MMIRDIDESEITFRDRPINIDGKGSRKWVYAKKPKGKWYKRRTIVSVILLLFFVSAPFIKVGGYPLILLDIAHRKFIIFGAIFWAQDTFILALLMLSFIVFILVFTVTFGRIWCGWACPQTIFLEMVFRKIEFLIEGDYRARYKLDHGPLTLKKAAKKLLKHLIFIVISIAMTNVFLMWFIGSERWIELLGEPISGYWKGFSIMMVISAFFYWVYAYFREQICTSVCPYGRMQGVLLDSNSIAVTYDYKRGEPRGAKQSGDCIDCEQCLSVCPTGIDIRNGTQLECVNCAACVDQCDIVMKKIGKKPGLIRLDSENGIKNGHRTIWNARNRAYSVVLVLLFSFFIYTLFSRPAIETTILRTPGLMYQENDDGSISNLYNIRILNKTHEHMSLDIKILSHDGSITLVGNKIGVDDQSSYESTFILYLEKDLVVDDNMKVEFGIFSNDELIETYKTTFVGPK